MAERYPTPSREDDFGIEWIIEGEGGWYAVAEKKLPGDEDFASEIRKKSALTFIRLRRAVGAGDREEKLIVGNREAKEGHPPVATFLRKPGNESAVAVFCTCASKEDKDDRNLWKPAFYIPLWHSTEVYCQGNKWQVVFLPTSLAHREGLTRKSPNFSFSEDLNFESLSEMADDYNVTS